MLKIFFNPNNNGVFKMKKLLQSFFIVFLLFSSAEAQLITIDAQRDAFYDGLTGPDDGKIFFPSRCYLSDVGPGPENGNEDLSGIVWSCWEYPYLYYYAEITDDTILCNNDAFAGSNWSNDKIEIKYDPDPTMADVSGGVVQVGLSALDSVATNGLPPAQLLGAVDNINQDNELQLPNGTLYVSTTDDFARRKTDDGYILEFRIHLDYINKGGRNLPIDVIDNGVPFGATINIADNDSISRRDMLQWSAGHIDQAWSFPRYQGSVTLLGDNKIKYEAISPNDPNIVNDSAQAWYYNPFSSIEPNPISNIPGDFNLLQNYPNPFNPSTVIRYVLDKSDNVSLTIYNVVGDVVRNLLSDQSHSAGTYEVKWDAKDNKGIAVSSGVYFFQIKQGPNIVTRKMILMR